MSSRTVGRVTHRVKERLRQRKIVKQLKILYRLVPGSIPQDKKIYKVELVIRYIKYLTKVCELLMSNGVLTGCHIKEPENFPKREETVQEANTSGQVFLRLLSDGHWMEQGPVDFVDVETTSGFENDTNVAQANVPTYSSCPPGHENVGFNCYLPNILLVNNANTSWMDPGTNVPTYSSCTPGHENVGFNDYLPNILSVNNANTSWMDPGANVPPYSSCTPGHEIVGFNAYLPNILSVNNANTSWMDPGVYMPACSAGPLGYENVGLNEYVPNNPLVNSANTPLMDPRPTIPECLPWPQPYDAGHNAYVKSESNASTPWVYLEAESNGISVDTQKLPKLEIQSSFYKRDLFGEILLEKVRRNFAEIVAAERSKFKVKPVRRFRKVKSKEQYEYQNTDNTRIQFLYEKNSVVNVTDIDPGLCTVHVVKPSLLRRYLIKNTSGQRANKTGNGGLSL